ncbi:DUF1573 domain-containing protein [bacterium]|nr:DUF1573 domain-containing protein [bacterium]
MNIMKTLMAAVLLVLVAAPFAFSQTNTPAQDQCLKLEGTSDYYFGEIDPNNSVEHTFIYVNNCGETIEIERARASCGCTAAVLSEKVIPPGGKAEIQVKFTPPRGSRGKVTKTVSVYLKGDDKPYSIIRFSAKIKTDFEIHPQYIQLQNFHVGDKATGSVEIKNVSEDDLNFESISINMTTYADTAGDGRTVAMPLRGATVEPTSMKIKPGESRQITVSMIPVFKGQINGAVRLKTNKNEGIIQVWGIIREREKATLRQTENQSRVLKTD